MFGNCTRILQRYQASLNRDIQGHKAKKMYHVSKECAKTD